MKNDFCTLEQHAIYALDISPHLSGLLLSPFQYNVQNGFVQVPVDTFKDITDFLTELAVAKDAQARALAAAPIGQGQA